ncbi:MAG: ATP-binding protein [Chitinispirillales bacterium]|nr:ATP-binding protein [Chitinispirillales bacterium]
MKRLLPIGIQDFSKIRERGFVYVDKTTRIHELITGSGEPFFLSRPRRFGKSLLCSTLGAIFEGRRELFGEMAGRPALAINSLDWEWKKHPVIRIDLNAGDYANEGLDALRAVLSYQLKFEAEKQGVTLDDTNHANQFAGLIQKSCDKAGERTVVIIDEYDKPLLETINNPAAHEKIKSALKGFYGVLKSSDPYLRFLLLTGVTKFSQVSVFSDLNHLDDLTLDPCYADLCGITQEELERDFGPEIDGILGETGRSREEYMDGLRQYYNGYRFSKKPLKVYNPFGLLNHFKKGGEFSPYWYDTGTPTFLVKLIAEQKINIFNLTNMQVGYADFRQYDVENMRAEPVLYQSGYLTIVDYDDEDGAFTLDYPNIEVRASFAKSLLDRYLQAPSNTLKALIFELPKALRNGNIVEVMNLIRQYLASIPYDIIEKTENYYRTAIHLIFTMLGLGCRSEVRIADGRIDTLVETKNYVYCFKFKLDKTADEALAQIDTKEYLLPWTGSGKKLFKVGVNFDSEKRNIGEWKYIDVLP